jgi:ADP-ribose pyrophosphatase YjhB (NUDIX family)
MYRQPQQQFNPLTMLRAFAGFEGRQAGGDVLPGQTVMTGERGREVVYTPQGAAVVGQFGPELITPREGATVVPQAPVSPARAAGTTLKGIGGFMAPAMTSLGTGEVPAPTAWPPSGYEKVPEVDPRWGAVPFEAMGFLEPPAKLGAMAMSGLGAAARKVPKSILDMIPGTMSFKRGEPLTTHIGGKPVVSFKPPKDWSTVEGQNHDLNEVDFVAPAGKKLASGLVMVEPDGRVWLAKPKGGYGGYEHTFPKGGLEEGLHPQANAIKEAYEETGLRGHIVAHLGDYEGDTSVTRYYLARRAAGAPQEHGWESEAVLLAHPEDLPKLLNKQRDRTIAADMIGHSEHPWNKPPPAPGPTPESVKAAEAAAGPDYFPMDHWKQTGPQLGSNPGGTYTTSAGQQWYVKFPKTEDHARNEQLTNELYRLTGANVPHTMLVRGPEGKVGIASHMLPAGSPTFADIAATGADHSSYHPHLHDHFATDAWLANRDVLGLTNDNIMVNSDTNIPVRIDQGGGLRYRAMGEPKSDFGPMVNEWDYMLNKGKAKAVYGSMTPEKQVESIDRVLNVPWSKVQDAVEQYGPKDPKVRKALLGNLSARRFDLAKTKQGILKEPPPPEAPPVPKAEPKTPGLSWQQSDKFHHAWDTGSPATLHGSVGHFPEHEPGQQWSGIGGLEGPNKSLPFKLFGTKREAVDYVEKGYAAETKPKAVTYEKVGEGDHYAHAGGKKVAEITDLGSRWYYQPGIPNRYMVEPMGNGPMHFADTLAGAKVHIEANHPAWEPPPQKLTPGWEAQVPPKAAATEPWISPAKPSGATDIAAAYRKGEHAGDVLSYRETKDLWAHHGWGHEHPDQPFKKGEYVPPSRGPKAGQALVMDPFEEIPATKGALQQMLTRWLQPTEHAAARGASPFQTAAFRGTRGFGGPPREFPTPGSDFNAYFSTASPEVAMEYAIGEGSQPERMLSRYIPERERPRIQHLLLDTRNYLHVDAEGHNWTGIHEAAAAEAARRGKYGVVVNNTYDHPTGGKRPGEAPHTVFLTFMPGMHTVRSAGARFDPKHFGKIGLKHGIAIGAPGLAAAYSHGPAPEEYHEPNALGAR